MTYMGREVYDINGYPAVTWADHPTSPDGQSYAYVHRIVGYDMWGDKVVGRHVHHIDGDKYNWDKGNLELLTPPQHARQHHGTRDSRGCVSCGEVTYNKKYCSIKCSAQGQEKADWPETERLRELVDTHGYTGVGKMLGVSGTSVRKRLRNHS